MKNTIFSLLVLFIFAGCAVNEQPKNCYDRQKLELRQLQELKEVEASLNSYKSEYQEVAAYVNFMNQYVADYSKYISVAANASGFIKLMPIPYAGQISSATGFGAKMTLLVGNASKSVANLNNSIKTFETKLIAAQESRDSQKLQEAQRFADVTLIADINAAEQSLVKLKEGSASMLAASSMIREYYDSVGDALSKATTIFAKKEEAPKNAPSDKTLKTKNENFEQKAVKIFVSFTEAKSHIKNGSVIGELSKGL